MYNIRSDIAVVTLQTAIWLSVHIKLIRSRSKKSMKRIKAILKPFNIDLEIERNVRSYMHGSREWLHDEVESWLGNSTSTHRLFYIRMSPGKHKLPVWYSIQWIV